MTEPHFSNPLDTEMDTKNYKILFSLAQSIRLYPDIDRLLKFISREILEFINVKGIIVMLLDESKKEFFVNAAAFTDKKAEKKIKKIHFPEDKGIPGRILKTGEPIITSDTDLNQWLFNEIIRTSGYKMHTVVYVPIKIGKRMIGVLTAVNKKTDVFSKHDAELLSAIADTIAHPIENARINHKLALSYQEVKSLNAAKDKVIHHLSHELKTPVSVLDACLVMIEKKLKQADKGELSKIFQRAGRNIQRLLEMQYEIEDLLRTKDYKTFNLLSRLLDACTDELKMLITEEMGGGQVITRIQEKIEDLFGPRESISEKIKVNQFVEQSLGGIGLRFARRDCRIIKNINPVPWIFIPEDVLMKILEGLIRNAVENTPEKGEINVSVIKKKGGCLLNIEDFGVGITDENMALLFENYFMTYNTNDYSSRRPYDFGAGGRGFDLLRMKLFSEQYNFHIKISSVRCRHINDNFSCPGSIDKCNKCSSITQCKQSGGTLVSVFFPAFVDDPGKKIKLE